MQASEVAKHIIDYCISINNPVTNLKLQKMLYFLDMYHLINQHKRLITDEEFEAWDYGPVMRSVYNKYRLNGPLPINVWENFTEKFPSDFEKFLYGFIDKLAKMYPSELIEESHKPNTPWDIVYNQLELKYHKISADLMEKCANHYRSQVKK